MKLILPIEVANQVLGYLATRPYNEVYQLIAAIQEAAKPPVVKGDENVWKMDSKSDQEARSAA